MTRLAIIETDIPLPTLQAKHGTYGGVFTDLLYNAGLDRSVIITKHDIVNSSKDLPNLDVDKPDAILITGSRYNAYDDVDWINDLVKFTAEAIDQGVKTVGVCFGHQIIGRALGAKVGKNPKGWELSATPVKLSAKGQEIFPELAQQFNNEISIMQFHQDIVMELPKDTELLAFSDVCGVQGFYRPKGIWSVQGHPEFTAEDEFELIELRHEIGVIPEDIALDGLTRVNNRNDGPVIAKSMVRFIMAE